MTPRDVKDELYKAAETQNATLALHAATEFHRQRLWTSTSHYRPIEPDGTEDLIIASRPGTCSLCHKEFQIGIEIRWRSRVACHVECWDTRF